MLVGCFDREALPVRLSDLPTPFEFGLLNENWDQFMPYMEQAIHRIPALADCGVRTLVNGPESFRRMLKHISMKRPGSELFLCWPD